MNYRLGFFVLLICIGICIPAWGKVYIDIDSPAFQKFPTAIPDFKNLGSGKDGENLSRSFSEEMNRSLEITGFFRIIDRGAFLENKNRAGLEGGDIHFPDWRAIGADFLIKGGFESDGKALSVEFRLYDVVEGKLITGKKYWGTVDERKKMVLKFAGEVLLKLTGERGVFNTRIAFVGKKGDESEIYTVDFDGSGMMKLTNYQALTLLPNWSPDGKKMSFTSYMNRNPDFYLMNMDSRKVERLSSYKGLNLSGPWSPDGQKVLLVLSKDGNEEIYSFDVSERTLRRLTWDRSIDVSPTWSPNGREIAFVSNRSGSPQVFTMDIDGKNLRRLTFEGSYNTSPSWSPRGGKIAYEGATNGRFQIFLINEDGSNFMQLTFEDGGCEAPTWSPDGRYLAFTAGQKGTSRIGIVNANGLNLRLIDDMKEVSSFEDPEWSPYLDLY